MSPWQGSISLFTSLFLKPFPPYFHVNKPLTRENLSFNITFSETFPFIFHCKWTLKQQLGAEQDQLPCGSTGTSSGNCQETETCIRHDSLSKPSFTTPGRRGNAIVGRGNDRWTTSKNGYPCPCQNCSQGPLAVKTGRGSLVNHL